MMGAGAVSDKDSAEERANNIFRRMDINSDGRLTEQEFLAGCLADKDLAKILAPNVEMNIH